MLHFISAALAADNKDFTTSTFCWSISSFALVEALFNSTSSNILSSLFNLACASFVLIVSDKAFPDGVYLVNRSHGIVRENRLLDCSWRGSVLE
jgi:hypothetical protein